MAWQQADLHAVTAEPPGQHARLANELASRCRYLTRSTTVVEEKSCNNGGGNDTIYTIAALLCMEWCPVLQDCTTYMHTSCAPSYDVAPLYGVVLLVP